MKTKIRDIEIQQINRTAEILKTIAHPLRLNILEVLEQEESLPVGEIQKSTDSNVEQSLLSHHLIKMKDKGILFSRKEGSKIFYGLIDKKITGIFDCLKGCRLF